MIAIIAIVILSWLFSIVHSVRRKKGIKFTFKPINLDKLGRGK